MRIQLDTHALEALFPEGSEARVELQNAVIANYARKMKDNFLDEEVRKLVKSVIGEVSGYDLERRVKSEIESQFKNVGGYWNKAYSTKEQGLVDNAIRNCANSKVKELVDDWKEQGELKVSEFTDRMKTELSTHLDRLSNQEIAKLQCTVTTLVRANINEIIRQELANVLGGNPTLLNG